MMNRSLIIISIILFLGIPCKSQKAESYFESGQSKMRAKNISGALVDFNLAISINPDYELAYVSRGLCRMAQGNWAKAIADCNKAIELNPQQAIAYFVRGCAKANTGKNGCDDLYKSLNLGYAMAQKGIKQFCN